MDVDSVDLADERNDVAREALACLRAASANGELSHATATQARYILGSAGTLGMLEEHTYIKPACGAIHPARAALRLLARLCGSGELGHADETAARALLCGAGLLETYGLDKTKPFAVVA